MESKLSWFEIAVSDFDRAKKFYDDIFSQTIQVMDLGQLKMGLHNEKIGGAICWGPWYKPSPDGTLIYLNADPDLSEVEQRIEKAGGKIIQSKKLIAPGRGYMCLFFDSEGNRIALHSMN